MIIHKPRQIRIDLDPDAGFPVSMQVESRTLVIEDGQELMELPPHVTSLDPGSEFAQSVLGEAVAQGIKVLKTYQDEVQRLAAEVTSLNDAITAMKEPK